jgi:flagellar hook-basal body complex protein FliE
MTSPILPVAAIGAADPTLARSAVTTLASPHGTSFAQMIMGGIDHASQQAAQADAKIAAFAVDDTIPPHEVIFAIEQARHSLEMMLQVRSRLVEGFQEIMRMQL